MRKSFREPLVSQTASARVIEKLRAIQCKCNVSAPNPSCVHHKYAIRAVRETAPKRARPDAVSSCTIIPANHLFSRRDASSFDKSNIIQGFDKLLVCPRTYKLVVPSTLVTSILFDLHGSLVNGHLFGHDIGVKAIGHPQIGQREDPG